MLSYSEVRFATIVSILVTGDFLIYNFLGFQFNRLEVYVKFPIIFIINFLDSVIGCEQ